MTNKTPSGVKKHRESTKPESCQMDLCESITMVFTQKATFSLSSARPLLIHNFEVRQDAWLNHPQKYYGFIWVVIFKLYMHVQKQSHGN